MYDEKSVLAAVDQHTVLVLALCGGALVCNLVWFALSVSASRRDRAASCSLFAIIVFGCNDGSYLYRFDEWFGQRDHWFPQLFWVALLATVAFEALFWRQQWRFGHSELAPFLTVGQFRAALVVMTAAAFVVWEQLKATLDDPLYLGSFTILIVLSPVCGMAVFSRRGNGRGQSAGMWWWFSAMSALWLVGSTVGLGETVRSFWWCGSLVVSTLWGIAMALLVARHPTGIPGGDASATTPTAV